MVSGAPTIVDGLSFESPGLSFEKCFALLLTLRGLSSCKQGMVGEKTWLTGVRKKVLKAL